MPSVLKMQVPGSHPKPTRVRSPIRKPGNLHFKKYCWSRIFYSMKKTFLLSFTVQWPKPETWERNERKEVPSGFSRPLVSKGALVPARRENHFLFIHQSTGRRASSLPNNNLKRWGLSPRNDLLVIWFNFPPHQNPGLYTFVTFISPWKLMCLTQLVKKWELKQTAGFI